MPERAEIEAATDALLEDSGLPRYGGHRATVERRVRIALAAADRVRDARGDDEARFDEAGRRRYPKMLHGEAATAARHAEHARSPQDEDHEAGERWTMIRRRDWPNDQGSLVPRGAPVPESDERLEVFEVARVSPSRDGTVAVEDVRADESEAAER